ncbi:MAG: hypothetical protein AB7F43_08260 [Bacteriovoracia bacterium]
MKKLISSLMALAVFSSATFATVANAQTYTQDQVTQMSPEQMKQELERQRGFIDQLRGELNNAQAVEQEDGSVVYKLTNGARILTGIAAVASFGAITLSLYARGAEVAHGIVAPKLEALIGNDTLEPFGTIGKMGAKFVVPAVATFLFTWVASKLIENEIIVTKDEKEKLGKALAQMDLSFENLRDRILTGSSN